MPDATEIDLRTDLPITVIGGYLGSGKTTLLNHLLRRPAGRRLGVLVNDFGSVNIDASLIEADDGDIVQLTGGCVCCSFGDDLSGAVLRLAALPMHRRPDHLVLETSGVALPGPLVAALRWVPGIQTDTVVVVIDAANVRSLAADRYVGDVICAQINDADLLVVSKADLVTDLDSTMAWLATRSAAPVVIATNGVVPADIVLGTRLDGERLREGVEDRLREGGAPQHGGERFTSIALSIAEAHCDPSELAARLAAVPGLWRAKGFVRDALGDTHLIQIVGGRATVTRWHGDRAHPGMLICIGPAATLDVDRLSEVNQ